MGSEVVAGIIGILAGVAGTLAFRIDVNQLLERRDQKLKMKARNLCPHAMLKVLEKREDTTKIAIKGMIISPIGALDYTCQMCGLRTASEHIVKEATQKWEKDPGAWEPQYKKYLKIMRKLGAA